MESMLCMMVTCYTFTSFRFANRKYYLFCYLSCQSFEYLAFYAPVLILLFPALIERLRTLTISLSEGNLIGVVVTFKMYL